MNQILRKYFIASAIAVSIIAIVFLLDVAYFFATPIHISKKQLSDKDYFTYLIPAKASMPSVLEDLNHLGIVSRPTYLKWYAMMTHKIHRMKMGEYQFKQGTRPTQLLSQIVQGDAYEHVITFIEGWTFDQIMGVLNRNRYIKHELSGLSKGAIMQRLGYPAAYPEGLFYPDTYFFARDTSDIALLQRAYKLMQKKLNKEWEKRSKLATYHSPYEALIMASIIEKETAIPSERPIVAGLLLNRIRKNMKLQCDSTVIYGLDPTFKGSFTKGILTSDNLYNSYRYLGLPPTPITTPGLSAIHAALNPEANDYLYFVTKGGNDVSHQFSKNYEGHQKAVASYRKKTELKK